MKIFFILILFLTTSCSDAKFFYIPGYTIYNHFRNTYRLRERAHARLAEIEREKREKRNKYKE